jgi:hypothetical protein
MVAGELPPNFSTLSQGSGPVDIYNNIIQGNLTNDDGGGIRFLMPGNYTMTVYNNLIVDNISTHEGGGIALDDATNVRIYNNTVMKNLTTATATTSDGTPAPAGLSTGLNSDLLQAMLPTGAPTISQPLLFNNIFWDNRAGHWDGANVVGIGGINNLGQHDPNPINYWDIGVSGNFATLQPTYSILSHTANPGVTFTTTQYFVDPGVVSAYDSYIIAVSFRGDAHFVGNTTVAITVPTTIVGDYHLITDTLPGAFNQPYRACPTCTAQTITAPSFDVDNQPRPANAAGGRVMDIGADQVSNVVVLPASEDMTANITQFYMPLMLQH